MAKLEKSPELTLTFGYHTLEIAYQGLQPAGQVQLVWRGPGFQWEPINERFLVHATDQHPDDDFERGQLLARGLRCAACHQTRQGSTMAAPLKAPDLTALAGNIDRAWLVGWLTESKSEPATTAELRDDEVGRRMPHFGMSPQEASDIAQALFAASKEVSSFKPSRDFEKKSDKPKTKDKKEARSRPDAHEGRTLVMSHGCLACHALGSEGIALRDEDDEANYTAEARRDYFTYQLFGGGDLSGIATKRPADFFSRWLAKPESISAAHRMPQANLSDLQREDISLYLATLKTKAGKESGEIKGDATRGNKLIQQYRCAACHNLPEKLNGQSFKKSSLEAKSHWEAGCLGAPAADRACAWL